MNEGQQPTLEDLEREAEVLRAWSGFKLTPDQSRDQVCGLYGWGTWAEMLSGKDPTRTQ
jgi:hypothetical protein